MKRGRRSKFAFACLVVGVLSGLHILGLGLRLHLVGHGGVLSGRGGDDVGGLGVVDRRGGGGDNYGASSLVAALVSSSSGDAAAAADDDDGDNSDD